MNLKKKKYFVLRKTLKKKKLFLNYTREHAHHFFSLSTSASLYFSQRDEDEDRRRGCVEHRHPLKNDKELKNLPVIARHTYP